jgi:hypothetical protein
MSYVIPMEVLKAGRLAVLGHALKVLFTGVNFVADQVEHRMASATLRPIVAVSAKFDTIVGELENKPATDEQWREYDFAGRIYRIDNPTAVYFRRGGSTHRVVDAEGVVHCVPAPGIDACVLRWKAKDGQPPVSW